MLKILLTGGKGYIGEYLAEFLSKENEVIITSRNTSCKNERVLELLDFNSIRGVCSDCDVVIHTANFDERLIKDDPQKALLINSYATRQLYLDAVKNNVKLFIYFSTFHVYGKTTGHITEDTEKIPINDYGLTHLFAEMYLKQLSLNSLTKVACVRLTNGVGYPSSDNDKWYLLLNDCCKSAVEQSVIKLNSDGSALRDFVSINDVCIAIDYLLKTKIESSYEVYNVSSQNSMSILEVAELIQRCYQSMTGTKIDIKRQISTLNNMEKLKPSLFVSSEKIRKLGWCPCETLETTICDILSQLIKQKSNYNMLKS